MPNPGFEDEIRQHMNFQHHLNLGQQYDAVMVAAHPYTLHDSHGPGGIIPFRLADLWERKVIQSNVMQYLDAGDWVASNTAWMGRSNDLFCSDYLDIFDRKAFRNSDAHGRTRYGRKEIGRAANIFTIPKIHSGEHLRELIRDHSIQGNFGTYEAYTPAGQFISNIAAEPLHAIVDKLRYIFK